MSPSVQPAPARRDVVVLGSTGSVGTQALDVVTRAPDRFRVVGLAAGGRDVGLLARQVLAFRPEVVGVARASAVEDLQLALYAAAQRAGFARGEARLPRVVAGPDAAAEVARTPADVVLNAITGSVGLAATLAALDGSATLALANKESLVVGGPLVVDRARTAGGARSEVGLLDRIVPVDSEHSALAQCLRAGRSSEVARLVLTASGGPFRGRRRDELVDVTPADALAHPTWSMGPVVTVNSATLMNKGLEVIEAHLLFGVPYDRVAVMVHPQSVLHSMVEFVDGSTLAQVSPPDMRLPVALGLGWPDRVPAAAPGLDWSAAHAWSLEPLDDEAFPAVALCREAGGRGGVLPAVLNAANEECVAAFLDGRLPFLGIVDTVADVLGAFAGATPPAGIPTLDDILAAEREARRTTVERIAKAAA